jgi:hypothetical protein
VTESEITLGAIKAAAAKELGMTQEQVVALGLAQMREQALAQRASRGMRPSDRADAAAYRFTDEGLEAVLKEFDVSGGPSLNEYGLDQADMILKVDTDKDFANAEQRRRDQYVLDLQYEDEAKRGLFAADFDEPVTEKEPWHPRRDNEPALDDFIVKKKGVPLGFVKGTTGKYSKVSTDPDAVVKAVMAKRRSKQTEKVYDKKAQSTSVNIEGLPRTTPGGFVERETPGELFYPGASNNGPNVGSGPGQSPMQSGVANDIDMFNRLTNAIQTGQITDPAQLIEAEALRSEIKRRVDPAYDKAIIYDAGAKVAREDNLRFSPERAAAAQRASSERSVVGTFLPSNANFRGLGDLEIGLEGRMGGKNSYVKTVPTKTKAELANMPIARMVISPDDSIYGYADSAGQLINPVNIPAPSSPINAPVSDTGASTLMDVMENNQYQARASGTYPQVAIGQQMALLKERLARTGLIDSSVDINIRNLEQAETLFNQALSSGRDKNVKFTEFGKKDISKNPGAMELLAKMRYTTPEVAAFSNALIQMELGNRNNVNLDRKRNFLTTPGAYFPQHNHGYAHADPSNLTGSVILGGDYVEFDRADRMQDYQVGENISYANSRNAPQYRKLTGSTLDDLPANERAAILSDARRPYIGALNGESVPIEGRKSNPNYRFNSTGMTNPQDIAVRLKAQAERRAKRNNRKVDRERLRSNLRNNLAVTRRQLESEAAPRINVEPDAQQERAKRLAVQEHITRDLGSVRPHYKASEKQQKYYDKSRTVEELIGANALGIPDKPIKEQNEREYSVEYQPNAPDVPEGFIPRSDRKGRMEKIKDSLISFRDKPQYRTGRRVGYGAAGVLGASALAGLFSNEKERRNQQEQYQ